MNERNVSDAGEIFWSCTSHKTARDLVDVGRLQLPQQTNIQETNDELM